MLRLPHVRQRERERGGQSDTDIHRGERGRESLRGRSQRVSCSVSQRSCSCRQRDGLALSGGQHQVMLSARLETCPRVTFSGAGSVTVSLSLSPLSVRLSLPSLCATVLVSVLCPPPCLGSWSRELLSVSPLRIRKQRLKLFTS